MAQILDPERHGFRPRAPGSPVTIGRHVLGRTDSRFISASERFLGSPRFGGTRYWIDVERVKRAGGIILEAEDIVRDLARIEAKTKDAVFLSYIEHVRKKALVMDKEILIDGAVPASAVKGARAMALTRGLQFVQGVGFVVSAYELGDASIASYRQGSVRPVAAESIRQVGGWGAALGGMKLGMCVGGLFGIQTGPGAVITASVGGLIGGIGGYFGADWIADHLYED